MNNDTIFEVVSNLNHDGILHPAGSFITGAEGQYADLVADGVLRVVEGASSVEEARAIVAERNQQAVEDKAAEEATAPVDTWAPAKEEAPAEAPVAPAEEAPKPEDNANAPVKKQFTVKAENGIQLDGEGDKTYAMGEVVELDPETDQAKFFIRNGIVEAVPETDPSANL